MKKNTKTSTKSTELYVNMVGVDSVLDIKYNLIYSKVRANIPLITSEIDDLVKYGANTILDFIDREILEMFSDEEYEALVSKITLIKDDKLAEKLIEVIKEDLKKETPWYKKVWNWITKPFKKNK